MRFTRRQQGDNHLVTFFFSFLCWGNAIVISNGRIRTPGKKRLHRIWLITANGDKKGGVVS